MAAMSLSNKEIFNQIFIKDEKCGLLIGLETPLQADVDTLVVGLHSSSKYQPDKINNQTVHLPEVDEDCTDKYYPAGCIVVGVWLKCENVGTNTVKALEQLLNTFYEHCIEKIVVVAIVTDSPDTTSHHYMYYHRNNSDGILTERNNVSRMLPKTTICVRLKAPFTLYQTMSNDPLDSSQLDSFRNVISKSTLWIPDSQTLLTKGSNTTLVSLGLTINDGPVCVEMLQDPPKVIRPIMLSLKPITSYIVIPIRLDIVGIFPSSVTLDTVAQRLKKKLLTQLECVIKCMETFRSIAGIHHYVIPSQYVPVTVIYPGLPFNTNHPPTTDDSLIGDREKLHNIFCLPRDQPFFRVKNLHWPCRHDKYIINPHVGLHPSLSSDYQTAMVTGFYAYRHYMQDKFNDNGWGCAYRSLQTIWSWFQFQGYTDLESPSHTEIQETLVDCGDKPNKFIGSKEWIGSFEVSTVLNHKLQIDSRIQQCPSGSEMSGMGPVLLRHFQTEGTPIMIGGGVLAHTIIGVAYNRNTGSIKFLILDPHYTGNDELKLVLGKGCDWKNINFWDSTASYNMCLPIKPKEI